jgi:CRP/FNR family transcriptional regulator, cyclic AMP receptor protein
MNSRTDLTKVPRKPLRPARGTPSIEAPAKDQLKLLLNKSAWAQDISEGLRNELVSAVQIKRFEQGALVVGKGESVQAWVGVLSGLVKINSVSPEGKTVTFTGVPAGGWLGEGSMLKNEPRKYDVVAIRPSNIAFVPKRLFQKLLDTSIGFNQFLLRQLNERLGQFIGMVEHYRLLGPDARVARCIAGLYNPLLYPDHSPELSISQEELGYLCGISRQRVNQALRILEDESLVQRSYGSLVILDLKGLQSFSS